MKCESDAPASSEQTALVILRDTERSLRETTVTILAPILPEPLAVRLGEASILADASLEELAEIDLDSISVQELRPVRIRMGLLWVGMGALSMLLLLLYLSALHSEFSPGEQIYHYWHHYVWFVSIGISGMFMLGREALRPPDE
ncbi:MAG TPA: hypothetical protein IGS53_06050 [Leptolyngbyaceae cyanobacterium M33_DOE_097]|uniref:Uncharacterized protein n=1 Tax=Oscillatoriales cyanobacterium SpSt-418 TaxID=2282169 RepID=A0A7C3PCN1_9CYAN|nr:hypothetical protein [Leptolyngbyaceae cyanobacterium M33_DOE_097]